MPFVKVRVVLSGGSISSGSISGGRISSGSISGGSSTSGSAGREAFPIGEGVIHNNIDTISLRCTMTLCGSFDDRMKTGTPLLSAFKTGMFLLFYDWGRTIFRAPKARPRTHFVALLA